MKHNAKKYMIALLTLIMVISCITVGAAAAPIPFESATATGSYRHPATGSIEDSGGTSSEALGQSMVTSVVSPDALMETAPDGTLYLSLRFNLMSNISSTKLSVQKPGETSWSPVSYEVTGKGDDSQDLRIPVPSKDAVVRAECFVDAMGRAVIFYVTTDHFTAGNAGNFAQLDENHLPDAAPAKPKADGSVVGDDVVGLVTGGSGKASSEKTSSDSQMPTQNAPVQEVIITWRVWVMFFLLVFCAQMLACLCFSGIKVLIRRFKAPVSEPRLPSLDDEPEEDMDFLNEAWDENWEESKDEVR